MAVETRQVVWELRGRDAGASSAFRSIESSMERLKSRYAEISAAFATVIGVVGGGAIQGMLRVALEAEQANKRLEAVLRAQGAAARFTKGELDEMAESLMEATQFDDESIRAGQATLLKFGNIHDEVFRRALRSIADYAAYTGKDFREASQVIGKAMQSPTEGITSLEREIGKLLPRQKEHINELMRQNRGYEAQLAVLDLVDAKLGGTAMLMNAGWTKATGDVSKQWSELLETLSKNGNIIQRVLGGTADVLRDIRLEIEGTDTALRNLVRDTAQHLDQWRGPLALPAWALADKIAGVANRPNVYTEGGRVPNTKPIRGPDGRQVNREAVSTPTPVVELGGANLSAAEQTVLMNTFLGAWRQLENRSVPAEIADNAVVQIQRRLADLNDPLRQVAKNNPYLGQQLIERAAQEEQRKAAERASRELREGLPAVYRELDNDRKNEARELQMLRERYVEMIDPLEKYRAQLENIRKLRERGLITPDQETAMLFRTNVDMDQELGIGTMVEKHEAAAEQVSNIWRVALEGMQHATADFLFDTMQGNLDDFGRRFKTMTDRMVADWFAAEAMMAMKRHGHEWLGWLIGTGTGMFGNTTQSGIGVPIIEMGMPYVGPPSANGMPYVWRDMFIPAHRGESLRTAAQTREDRAGGKERPTVININFNGPPPRGREFGETERQLRSIARRVFGP